MADRDGLGTALAAALEHERACWAEYRRASDEEAGADAAESQLVLTDAARVRKEAQERWRAARDLVKQLREAIVGNANP